MKDLYQILGVSENADDAAIKAASSWAKASDSALDGPDSGTSVDTHEA